MSAHTAGTLFPEGGGALAPAIGAPPIGAPAIGGPAGGGAGAAGGAANGVTGSAAGGATGGAANGPAGGAAGGADPAAGAVATDGPGGLLSLTTQPTVLHDSFGWLVTILEWAAAVIDLAAIAILLIGGGRFILGVAAAEISRRGADRVAKTNRERIELGRYILAGLELFIVSDVIHTALSLRMADLLFLLVLVVIRSVTSYFLDRELAGLRQELGR